MITGLSPWATAVLCPASVTFNVDCKFKCGLCLQWQAEQENDFLMGKVRCKKKKGEVIILCKSMLSKSSILLTYQIC